jgi:hypothetical protein
MNSLNSFKLAELRQQELRADAGRVRLAAEARRAQRRRSRLDWLRRIACSRRRYARSRSAKPAAVTSMARPRSFDDLASRLAVNGPAAMHDQLTRFVESDAG